MSGPRYAELQVTTNFSFLRGASHPHELVAQGKALGLDAIAVTDRNTFAGIVRAHVAAAEMGLRLVPGVRLDLQDGPSLLCFPRDRAAYGRLSRLLSEGQLRAGKGGCLLFLADVAAHAEGQIFIALPDEAWDWRREPAADASGQLEKGHVLHLPRPAGMLPREPVDSPPQGGCDDDASPRFPGNGLAATLQHVKAILPEKTPLYLAASYAFRGDDRTRIATLARVARWCNTPLVATGDVLYHTPARRPLQDVLTAIREHTTVAAAGLRLEANAERHLKPAAEIMRLFKGHEDAVARTREIVDACRFSLDQLRYEYPDEPIPPGTTPQSHLEALTWEGARRRFPDGIPDKILETLRRELALIERLEYAPYFLTVYDIVNFAHEKRILAQGRGSAANSVVCY
jgi:error-prone DNA polymerase